MAIEKAFVRFNGDGQPVSEASYSLCVGLKAQGIVPFTKFEQLLGHLTPETLVHGWVGDVRRAVDKLGFPKPSLDSMPVDAELLGRKMWRTTLKEVRNNANSWPVFIKPEAHKIFTGYVIRDFAGLIETSDLPDDLPIVAQTPVEFVSEYRCFMHWDKPMGIRQYKGDCTVFPDVKVLAQITARLLRTQTLPCAYTIDLGVLASGETVVVELNDGFSMGGYGLAWPLYLNMVTDRWVELTTPRAVWGNHLVDLYLRDRITYNQFQIRFLDAAHAVHEQETRTLDEKRLSHAHLIWCEYTSFDPADESWFRGQLTRRLELNPTSLWMP